MSAHLLIEADELRVSYPYNEACTAALKRAVPRYARQWKPDLRAWVVDPSWRERVEDVLRDHFPELQVVDTTRPVRRNVETSPYADLISALPDQVLTKLYRSIAFEMHPDRGGTTDAMTRVNTAWQRIKQLRRMR